MLISALASRIISFLPPPTSPDPRVAVTRHLKNTWQETGRGSVASVDDKAEQIKKVCLRTDLSAPPKLMQVPNLEDSENFLGLSWGTRFDGLQTCDSEDPKTSKSRDRQAGRLAGRL